MFFFSFFFNKVAHGDGSLVISRCYQGGIFCHFIFIFLERDDDSTSLVFVVKDVKRKKGNIKMNLHVQQLSFNKFS